MTKFKVGDHVVRTEDPYGNLPIGSVGVVRFVGDRTICLEGFPSGLDAAFFKLSTPPNDDPPAADVGTYYVATLNPKNNGYSPQHSQHDYWVDAEAEAEKMARAFPESTFAVLKLVGTVHTSTVWS